MEYFSPVKVEKKTEPLTQEFQTESCMNENYPDWLTQNDNGLSEAEMESSTQQLVFEEIKSDPQ